MDAFKATRDAIVAQFEKHAAALFATDAGYCSAMLAVAQYWDDQANDEVHARVIASTRTTPVWPHECQDNDDTDNDEVRPTLPGEACWWCGGERVDMRFYGGYADDTVHAVELFCAEGSHQNQSDAEAYLPWLVARRRDDGTVDVEMVGQARRVPGATIGSAGAAAGWPDARARALFDEVCRHAEDDGPRTVLSDYLLEAHPDDARGEAIALALARDLDAETRARRDALFAAHADRWLDPLGEVIAPGCAHFERGFLARADVFASSAAAHVRDAPAWGTVHTIRLAPASRDLVTPAMRALRSIGPLRDDGAAQIAHAPRPWRIEHIRFEDGAYGPLVGATNLPRLAHLEIPVGLRDRVADFRRAPWWRQLACLGFLDVDEPGALADWRALRADLEVPELALATGGWRLGFTAEDTVSVRWGAWHPSGTLPRLAVLAASLAAPMKLALVSTRERVFTDDDVAWLRDHTDRDIMLRA